MRRAFTLPEILVTLAILAVLAAVIIPSLGDKVVDSEKAALSQTLDALNLGIAEYRKATTKYPLQISVLTNKPVAGTTTDACGGTNFLTTTHVNGWRGPYLSRDVSSSGMIIGKGEVQNTLRRVTSGTAVFLLIDVYKVDRAIALDLESELDAGTADSTAGTIRWTGTGTGSSSSGEVGLTYAIPISGC